MMIKFCRLLKMISWKHADFIFPTKWCPIPIKWPYWGSSTFHPKLQISNAQLNHGMVKVPLSTTLSFSHHFVFPESLWWSFSIDFSKWFHENMQISYSLLNTLNVLSNDHVQGLQHFIQKCRFQKPYKIVGLPKYPYQRLCHLATTSSSKNVYDDQIL